jgi:hypothetical protein
MIANLLELITGLKGIESISYSEWSWGGAWHPAALFFLILAAVGFSVWTYSQVRAGSREFRIAMGALRASALILFLVILFEPGMLLEFTRHVRGKVLVLVDTSESMSINDKREADEILEVAHARGLLPVDQTQLNNEDKQKASAATRLDIASGIIDHNDWGILNQLSVSHDVRLFGFSGGMEQFDVAQRAGLAATGRYTNLGAAIEKASDQYSGQMIDGMILLSDFAWNQGADPVRSAERLGKQGVPIFAIGIGLPAPPDVSISNIYAPDTQFVGEKLSVKVLVNSTPELAGSEGVLELKLKDSKQSRMIRFNGEHQIEEFEWNAPTAAGDYQLQASVKATDDEAVTENNRAEKQLQVIDEKIKVLYVEGMPRWEYRYLRWVLLRDPRLDVKFLLTQGDRDLAVHSPNYLVRFPEQGRSGLNFDLVILGDVPRTYFNSEQLAWMEELVRRRGGALLMIAGSLYSPSTYRSSPVADLLPVQIEDGPWEKVSKRDVPLVTPDGIASGIVKLERNANRTNAIFRTMRPLHSVPPVTAKPAATVLVKLQNLRMGGEPYPLISWHRYGAGKTMFVGSEKLWRIRFKVGRKYHERLWAQSIQFLALSRLLGGNRRITLKTGRPVYAAGEQVQVFANVLDRFFEPVMHDEYSVSLKGDKAEAEVRRVRLRPVTGIPGFYQGYLVAPGPGRYVLKAPPESIKHANAPQFQVKDISLEMRHPGLQMETARQLGQRTQGMTITSVKHLPEMYEAIRARQSVRVERMQIELWDNSIVYLLLMMFSGTEWFFRRRRRLI